MCRQITDEDFYTCIERNQKEMAITLLDKGVEAEPADVENNQNYAYWVVHFDRPEILQALLDHGANPLAKDRFGETPLSLAQKSHPDLVPMLQGAIAKSHGTTSTSPVPALIPPGDKAQPIIDAVKKDDAAALAKLVEGVDVGKIQSGGEALLFDSRNPEVTKILLEHGADANARDGSGRPAWARICVNAGKNALPIARVLLDHKADPNAKWGPTGETPLFYAQDGDMVDLLVAHGADTQVKLSSGDGVLLDAAQRDPSVFEALLRHGVPFDVHADGPTLLVHASIAGNSALMAKLIARGVDPNVPGVWYHRGPKVGLLTPLTGSIFSRQVPAVALLLDHGAKTTTDGYKTMILAVRDHPDIAKLLWSRGNRDASPLLYAIGQGASVGDITKLLDQGSPADPPQDTTLTPLGYAAMKGQLDAVTLLIARGADVNKGGVYNPEAPIYRMTPLVMAAFEGQDEVVTYLLAHGAKPDPAALYYAANDSIPYANEQPRDHFEKTVRVGGAGIYHLGANRNATGSAECDRAQDAARCGCESARTHALSHGEWGKARFRDRLLPRLLRQAQR